MVCQKAEEQNWSTCVAVCSAAKGQHVEVGALVDTDNYEVVVRTDAPSASSAG
ncbi:hypothetical protein OH77DRAFT_1419840 [Trametes cingulata]|nr:hypothetical protein OH77DRAFT_1419840 [Trametes cingulata]